MDFELLGSILKTARCSRNYKQSEIADKLNVTFQNVSSWERGKSKIDIDMLNKLCDIYKISLADLLRDVTAGGKSAVPAQQLTTDESQLFNNYCNLNQMGQQVLLLQSQAMVMQDEYKKTVEHAPVEKDA